MLFFPDFTGKPAILADAHAFPDLSPLAKTEIPTKRLYRTETIKSDSGEYDEI
jgi:hypothetical protein